LGLSQINHARNSVVDQHHSFLACDSDAANIMHMVHTYFDDNMVQMFYELAHSYLAVSYIIVKYNIVVALAYIAGGEGDGYLAVSYSFLFYRC